MHKALAFSIPIATAIIVAAIVLPIRINYAKTDPQAQVTYDIVNARMFRLIDEKGNIKGALTCAEGNTALVLNRTDSQPGLMLAITKDNVPSLVLFAEDNQSQLILDQNTMKFYDAQGNTRLALGFNDAGGTFSSALLLSDPDGKVRLAGIVTPDGLPMMGAVNDDGKFVVQEESPVTATVDKIIPPTPPPTNPKDISVRFVGTPGVTASDPNLIYDALGRLILQCRLINGSGKTKTFQWVHVEINDSVGLLVTEHGLLNLPPCGPGDSISFREYFYQVRTPKGPFKIVLREEKE